MAGTKKPGGKRLARAISRRTKLEKAQHKAVVANQKKETKASRKRLAKAKSRLEHQRKVVKALQEGRTPPKMRKASGAAKKPSAGKKPAKKTAAKKSAAKKPAKKTTKPKSSKPKKAKKSGKRPKTVKQLEDLAASTEKRYQREAKSWQKKYEAALKREQHAKSSGSKRSEKEIKRLEKHLANLKAKMEHSQQMAAEAKKKKKGKKKNPVSGAKETAAAIFGGVLGGVVLVLGDNVICGLGNLQTTPGTGGTPATVVDQPAQGGVYVFEAQSLPFWSRFWKRGIWRVLFALLNTGGPLLLARALKKHAGWQSFFDAWGFTDTAIVGVKVIKDAGAAALGKKTIGMRLFAPELVAKNALAGSKAGNMPPVAAPIVPGSSGALGYGPPAGPPLGLGKDNGAAAAPAASAPKTGAGAPAMCECGRGAIGAGKKCCAACEAGQRLDGAQIPPPPRGGGQPIPPTGVNQGNQPAPPAPAPTPPTRAPGAGKVRPLFPNDGPRTGLMHAKRI